jgi:hypothetical protein
MLLSPEDTWKNRFGVSGAEIQVGIRLAPTYGVTRILLPFPVPYRMLSSAHPADPTVKIAPPRFKKTPRKTDA